MFPHDLGVPAVLAVSLSQPMGIWPQFRSNVMWDVFAVSTTHRFCMFCCRLIKTSLRCVTARAASPSILYGMLHGLERIGATLLVTKWLIAVAGLTRRGCFSHKIVSSISPSRHTAGTQRYSPLL